MKLDSLRLDAAALLKNRQDAGSVRRIGRIISGNDGLAHAFDCLDSLETLMQDKDNPRIGDCLLVKAQIEKAIEFVSKTIVDFDTWETH